MLFTIQHKFSFPVVLKEKYFSKKNNRKGILERIYFILKNDGRTVSSYLND